VYHGNVVHFPGWMPSSGSVGCSSGATTRR
jgi:hypothetical protein